MNTKKTLAALAATLMVMVVFVPMAMASTPGNVVANIDIKNVPPVIHQKWETVHQNEEVQLVGIKSLKCLIDEVNIGDLASEADNNLAGWGPIEPATHGGNWGSNAPGDDGNCRVTWEPEDPTTRDASFTLANPGNNAHQLQLRVLDGLGDDSFTVTINDIQAYTYIADNNGNEEWKTHKIYITDDMNDASNVLTIKITSTAGAWAYFGTYGQLGVTWAKLFYDCCCEDPVSVWPGDVVTVNKYAIVSDNNGAGTISSVIVKVYNPDGTLKERQALQAVVKAEAIETINEAPLCDADKKWKLELIEAGEVLYKGSFTMGYTDPSGDYKMVYDAIDTEGLVDSLANDIFYESVVILDLDFTAINYGTVVPTVPTWVYGDYEDGCLPSIHNGGNDLMDVTIKATDFTGPTTIPSDSFGADVNYTGAQIIGPNAALFAVSLPYCEWVPVDFSVIVPAGTQSGAYTGSIIITGVHAV